MTSPAMLRVLPAAIGLGLLAYGGLQAQTVLLEGTVKAQPRVIVKKGAGGGAYASRALQDAVLFDYEHLKNVVVSAEPTEAAARPSTHAKSHSSMTFKLNSFGMQIYPEFLVVSAGSEVTFQNATPQPLTVYADGISAEAFMLEVPAKGESKRTLEQKGLYTISSGLEYPEVRAKIFAAGPYAVVADDKGRYSLNLPPGHYRVTAWHQRLPAQSQEVDILQGGQPKADFTLSVKGLPEVK